MGSQNYLDEKFNNEEFINLFENAYIRLENDVPLAFVSGSLDSTAIVKAINKNSLLIHFL